MSQFGYTTVTSNTTRTAGYICGVAATLTETGTVTSISWYGKYTSVAGNIQFGIYSQADPKVLLGNTGSVALPSSAGWVSGDLLTPVELEAGSYFLCWNAQQQTTCYYAALAPHDFYKLDTFGSWTTPLGTWTDGASNRQLAIYATYTAGGTTNVVQMIL